MRKSFDDLTSNEQEILKRRLNKIIKEQENAKEFDNKNLTKARNLRNQVMNDPKVFIKIIHKYKLWNELGLNEADFDKEKRLILIPKKDYEELKRNIDEMTKCLLQLQEIYKNAKIINSKDMKNRNLAQAKNKETQKKVSDVEKPPVNNPDVIELWKYESFRKDWKDNFQDYLDTGLGEDVAIAQIVEDFRVSFKK